MENEFEIRQAVKKELQNYHQQRLEKLQDTLAEVMKVAVIIAVFGVCLWWLPEATIGFSLMFLLIKGILHFATKEL